MARRPVKSANKAMAVVRRLRTKLNKAQKKASKLKALCVRPSKTKTKSRRGSRKGSRKGSNKGSRKAHRRVSRK